MVLRMPVSRETPRRRRSRRGMEIRRLETVSLACLAAMASFALPAAAGRFPPMPA